MKDRLLNISEKRKKEVQTRFVRYLYDDIDWTPTLILIKGARGSGKTTLLLQHFKNHPKNAVYLSLDDFYFESNRLLLLLEELYESGYRKFYLDEVHQYQHWSKDLKNLYDNYPDVQIIATGSSALQIDKGSADLSRRMTEYQLFGLSFREYLDLEFNVKTPVISLEDLLNKHEEYSVQINDLIQPLEHFGDYLKFGYYPFYRLDKKFYHQKLQQTIHLTLDVDLPAVETLNFSTIKGMKNLLFVLSQLVPYTPNIQNLASKINSPRNSVLKALDLMDKSNVLNLLRSDTKGVSYLQKPEKIFLQNTNLLYVFNEAPPNKGSLRETYFFNQLQVKHRVTAPKYGDFMIDDTYTFEIGGATKTAKQISGVPLSYIAADDLKFGSNNKIPLWLFGFLY